MSNDKVWRDFTGTLGRVRRHHDGGAMVDAVTVQDLKDYKEGRLRLYRASNGQETIAGAAVRDLDDYRSEVCLVHSAERGGGDLAMSLLLERESHRFLSLSCFDGHLVRFYAKHGFKEVDRVSWDDKYAPYGWDYDKWGRPDVVTMVLPKTRGC